MGYVLSRPNWIMVFWKLLAHGGLVISYAGSAWFGPLGFSGSIFVAAVAVGLELQAGPPLPLPAAAATLPSVKVHRGYIDPEFAGPGSGHRILPKENTRTRLHLEPAGGDLSGGFGVC